jgi:hypothetical protein
MPHPSIHPSTPIRHLPYDATTLRRSTTTDPGPAMRRLALLLLLLAPPAHAVPITGYAVATIESAAFSPNGPTNANGGPNSANRYGVGGTVYLAYTLDTGQVTQVGAGAWETRLTSYHFVTTDVYNVFGANPVNSSIPNLLTVTDGPVDRVRMSLANENGLLWLTFTDPTGQAINGLNFPTIADLGRFPEVTLMLDRVVGQGADGFIARGRPVANADDFPVPEPGGLALGLIGAGVLAVARWRVK